jgi:hypothetical protein
LNGEENNGGKINSVHSMNCQDELIKRGATKDELDRKDKEADRS